MFVISLSLTYFFVNETHESMKENLITFPVAKPPFSPNGD